MIDFTRIQWTSAHARSVWEPRLQRITQAWAQVEQESVRHYRQAALTAVTPAQLPHFVSQQTRVGLICLPLTQLEEASSYSASSIPADEKKRWVYRVVTLASLEAAQRWQRAWDARDDDALGILLGYPACCRKHFQETWGKGSVDPTGQMALPAYAPPEVAHHHIQDVPPENQILGRWLGVRLVPHLPCSWDCAATARAGLRYAQLMEDLGYREEVGWARAILSWPMEWNARNGIAEIRTPLVRISTRTNPGPPRIIRCVREDYPEEGATGTRFPYPRTRRRKVQLVTPAVGEVRPSDNGFASVEAMSEAHSVIVQVAQKLGKPDWTWLDLGAGNGELLRALLKHVSPEGRGIGIEIDPTRIGNKGSRNVLLRVGNIATTYLWSRDPVNAVLLMPGRLEEMSPAQREEVVQALRKLNAPLLLYAYGDWLRTPFVDLVHRHLPALPGREYLYRGATVAAGWWDLAPTLQEVSVS